MEVFWAIVLLAAVVVWWERILAALTVLVVFGVPIAVMVGIIAWAGPALFMKVLICTAGIGIIASAALAIDEYIHRWD